MIVACNLPSGLNLGFVTLTPAHRDPGYQATPKPGMVGHLVGADGREFLGSYALTQQVDDAGLDRWARDNAGSTIIASGAVLWAPTLDELIGKLAVRRPRSHAQIQVT